MIYQLAKALHLFAMVIWMSGMIFAPLAVGARGGTPDPDLLARYRRLFGLVTTPAMLAVWVFGLILATSGGWLSSGWMLAKIGIVVVLSGLHGAIAGQLRRAAATGSGVGALGRLHYTVIGLVLAAIVLAVFRPF